METQAGAQTREWIHGCCNLITDSWKHLTDPINGSEVHTYPHATQFYMFGSAAQWEHSYAFTQSTESADTQKSTSLNKYTINVLINNIMWHVTTPFSHLHCINLSGSVTPGLQFHFKKSAWTKWSIFNFSYNFGFQLILEQEQKLVSAHFSFTFSRKVQTLSLPGCGITASVHTDLLI